MGWLVSVCILIFWIITWNNQDKTIQKQKQELKEYKAEINNLKDEEYVANQKRLAHLQAEEITKVLTSFNDEACIKVARVPFGKLIRAFSSDYVFIQFKDIYTLEVIDNYSVATIKCDRCKKREIK